MCSSDLYTTCNICEATCGLAVHVSGNRVTGIEPDTEHVASQGYACVKGLKIHEVHHSPDRLRHPQKRVGDRFIRISWDQALREIGQKARQLRRDHGADSLSVYLGNPISFNFLSPVLAAGFAQGLGTKNFFQTGSQDCNNKFVVAQRMYGFPFVQPYPDVDRTQLLICVGSNPAVSRMSFIHLPDPVRRLKAIEKRGAADQAGRVLQRVKAIFRYAVTHERIDSNPMLDLMPAEVLKPRHVQHRPALADRELPEFLAKLASYDGDPHTVQALRLLMLTAVRPGEVRGARWAEFDLEAAQWRIPAERMKMRTEHLVPLSTQALEVLRTMQALTGERDLVFPSPFYPSKPLSENTFNSAMARMGYKGTATAHGFRALFSTVANECGWNPDVIERQLAHAERNEVRAAYHRSTYLQDRTKLLQWWADYLDGKRAGTVVPLRKRASA